MGEISVEARNIYFKKLGLDDKDSSGIIEQKWNPLKSEGLNSDNKKKFDLNNDNTVTETEAKYALYKRGDLKIETLNMADRLALFHLLGYENIFKDLHNNVTPENFEDCRLHLMFQLKKLYDENILSDNGYAKAWSLLYYENAYPMTFGLKDGKNHSGRIRKNDFKVTKKEAQELFKRTLGQIVEGLKEDLKKPAPQYICDIPGLKFRSTDNSVRKNIVTILPDKSERALCAYKKLKIEQTILVDELPFGNTKNYYKQALKYPVGSLEWAKALHPINGEKGIWVVRPEGENKNQEGNGLSAAEVTSIAFLNEIPANTARQVYISRNAQVKDFSPLEKHGESIESLNVYNTKNASAEPSFMKALKKMTKLKSLVLSGAGFSQEQVFAIVTDFKNRGNNCELFLSKDGFLKIDVTDGLNVAEMKTFMQVFTGNYTGVLTKLKFGKEYAGFVSFHGTWDALLKHSNTLTEIDLSDLDGIIKDEDPLKPDISNKFLAVIKQMSALQKIDMRGFNINWIMAFKTALKDKQGVCQLMTDEGELNVGKPVSSNIKPSFESHSRGTNLQ